MTGQLTISHSPVSPLPFTPKLSYHTNTHTHTRTHPHKNDTEPCETITFYTALQALLVFPPLQAGTGCKLVRQATSRMNHYYMALNTILLCCPLYHPLLVINTISGIVWHAVQSWTSDHSYTTCSMVWSSKSIFGT